MDTLHRVHIQPWPSEALLRLGVVLVSCFFWFALLISIIGPLYGFIIGIGVFFAQVAFVAHIRGSGVKLGPQQFPDLYQRVQHLAQRIGLPRCPDVYIMESGGALNAMAMRFFRARMVILYSDLLDACADDPAARDMIVAHELGHLHAGHLNFSWFLFPGRLMPFLGHAYSRACEFTCDRYGMALCGGEGGGDRDGALRGLAILAAGAKFGPQVNLRAFVEQKQDLDSGWMSIGT